MGATPSIGIGIITRNRKQALAQVIQRIHDTTTLPYDLVVGADRCEDGTLEYLEQIGVTYVIPPEPGAPANRNVALHALKEHDVIFMFEDDFAPTRAGWMERHIQALQRSPLHCLYALTEAHGAIHERVVYPGGLIEVRQNLTSQMTALTRDVLETVGYYAIEFGARYGFDDGEWGNRVANAGLTRRWASLPDTLDWFEYLPAPSSDGKPEALRSTEAERNSAVWEDLRARGHTYTPYPF